MRDLFVELSAALFEVLKGIGEEAVRRAESKTSARMWTERYPLDQDAVLRAVRRCYGWRSLVTERSPFDLCTLLWVRWECGHGAALSISDHALFDGPYTLFDKLDELAAGGRVCSCVLRGNGHDLAADEIERGAHWEAEP